MLTAKDLHKRYGAITALDGISLETVKGEIFGLLGPNGAGKTTAIQILSGLLRPDRGEVRIDGAGDPLLPQARARLGVAPQSLALYEDLSAEENLAFFGRMYGLAGKALKARIEECLKTAALVERRAGRVSGFSGGMKRRLNLACALMHAPPLLLLDEPMVGVDPQSRNLLFETLGALKAAGTTLLYTTHYMDEAQRLCDRVAIVDSGRILALDTVANLLARHGSPARIEIELERLPENGAALPGQLQGNTLRLATSKPAEDLSALLSQGLSFLNVRIEQSNLEDVFLNLTGRSLRDE